MAKKNVVFPTYFFVSQIHDIIYLCCTKRCTRGHSEIVLADHLEFKTNTFCNNVGAMSINNITEMKVPYSEDHSVLEYYKELIDNSVILEEIESITEKEKKKII